MNSEKFWVAKMTTGFENNEYLTAQFSTYQAACKWLLFQLVQYCSRAIKELDTEILARFKQAIQTEDYIVAFETVQWQLVDAEPSVRQSSFNDDWANRFSSQDLLKILG